MIQTFLLPEMSESNDTTINSILYSTVGILGVTIHHTYKTISVLYNENTTNIDVILQKIKTQFDDVQVINDSQSLPHSDIHITEERLKKNILYSFIFSLPLYYLSLFSALAPAIQSCIELALCLIIFFINKDFILFSLKTYRAKEKHPLVLFSIVSLLLFLFGCIHTILSIVHSKQYPLLFASSSSIYILYSFLTLYRDKYINKYNKTISTLQTLKPKDAIVRTLLKDTSTPMNSIHIGDLVVVKANEIIPCDGIVMNGLGQVNECTLTGNKDLLEKSLNAKVYQGTTLQSGEIEVRVNALQNTALDALIQRITCAIQSCTQTNLPLLNEKYDLLSLVSSIVISVLTYFILKDYTVSFALLCAILLILNPYIYGILPVFIHSILLDSAASNHILFKNQSSLTSLKDIRTFIFEKNKTVTSATPKVTDVILSDHITPSRFYYIAYSLKNKQKDPVSRAIIQYLKSINFQQVDFKEFKQLSTRGVLNAHEKKQYLAGDLSFMENNGHYTKPYIKTVQAFQEEGKASILFAEENKIVGIIAVADEIKIDSKPALEKMKAQGKETILITSNSEKIAQGVTAQLPFTSFFASLNHQKKKELLMEQKLKKKVAFISGEEEDYDLFPFVDEGIRFDSGCTHIEDSMNAAITLTNNSLEDLNHAISYSMKAHSLVKEYVTLTLVFVLLCSCVTILCACLFKVYATPFIAMLLLLLIFVEVSTILHKKNKE